VQLPTFPENVVHCVIVKGSARMPLMEREVALMDSATGGCVLAGGIAYVHM
jgi:hypothetical protein